MGPSALCAPIVGYPPNRKLTQTHPAYRLKQEIVAALAEVPGVLRIASFGSVAVGQADLWSDLDLLVEVDQTAWLAAAAIRLTKPVLFYRPFTGVPQPSGRYWFADESPFTRLDVSFYAPADFEAVCRNGLKEEHSVNVRIEHIRGRPHEEIASGAGSHASLDITPAEIEAGRLLYVHLEAVKAARRAQPSSYSQDQTREALRLCLATQLTPAGDDFERLARLCLDL